MRERLQLPMAMWRVHFDLLGGGRRTVLIVLGYTAILGGGLLGFRRLFFDLPIALFADRAVTIIASFQTLIIVIGGCNAIFRALTRDYDTKMIESHRLSPMSNVSVVLGYLFGPTLHMSLLFLVNIAVGALLTNLSGGSMPDWLWGNAVLFSAAVTAWTVTVFGGVKPGKPLNPISFLIPVGFLSSIWLVVPVGGLLTAAFAVILSFWAMTGMATVPQIALTTVLIVNFALVLFWLSACAAKYRRPDLPSLNALRGMILLLVWLGVGAASVTAFEKITSTKMPQLHQQGFLPVQWVCTIISSLLVATVPISGAVGCRVLIRRGTAPRDWSDRVSDSLVTLLAAILLLGVLIVVGWQAWHSALAMKHHQTVLQADVPFWQQVAVRTWAFSATACILALLAMRSWLTVMYKAMKRPVPATTVALFFVWAAFPLADYIRAAIESDMHRGQMVFTWLFGCSPVGTILGAWGQVTAPLRIGLIVQAAMTTTLMLIAWRFTNRPKPTTTPDSAPLTSS